MPFARDFPYHAAMKIKPLLAALLLVSATLHAEGLPDLGDSGQADLSPAMERSIGETAMKEIRWHEPAYLDDPEVSDYLNHLGMRLASAVPDVRQDFEFFVLKDPTLNAFAMPGGYIGVHTTLILATQSESELAGVLSHEISHVTQHHIARMVGKQSQASMLSLASLLVGVLAARNSPQAAQAAIVGGTALGAQTQLNYSRDFEREADRMGFQILETAGFDVSGMANFFERLQKASRVYENNAPGYLRSHPLTTERIADMENRAQSRPYRQVPDSLDYQLVRAKLKVMSMTPADAVLEFQSQIKDQKFMSLAAAHYGLARAYLVSNNAAAAEKEWAVLRQMKLGSPMLDALAADIAKAQGNKTLALQLFREGHVRYPRAHRLTYGYVDALLAAGNAAEAVKVVDLELVNAPKDPALYDMQAKANAALGRRVRQHRALSELYALQGRLMDAIEQLRIAQKAGDGDFYDLSAVDARLRQLMAKEREEKKDGKGEKR